MKAITLWQPWASLISAGVKRIETRSWSAPAALLGERIAIHAGKTVFSVGDGAIFDRRVDVVLGPGWKRNIPRGAVVATAVLAGCEEMSEGNPERWPCGDEELFGDYGVGRFMWRLAEVELVEPPVPATGHPGFWDWQEEA